MSKDVTVEIIEQPESSFKYQYPGYNVQCPRTIIGVNSTNQNKTYPAISILVSDYVGPEVVLVSCVTNDKPHKPHPHRLVGKNCTSEGVCRHDFVIESSSKCIIQCTKLSIQYVKKEEIRKSLSEREKVNVDPFRTGFSHKYKEKSIDLGAVRLCFQVFLRPDKKLIPLVAPLVTDPIYHSKYTDLVIIEMSDVSSSVHGGKKILSFCRGVIREDVQVRFFEEDIDKVVIWEDWGILKKIHRQCAIAFFTPKYKSKEIRDPADVYIQLVSESVRGVPLPFQYIPDYSHMSKRKKRKLQKSEDMFEFLVDMTENDENETDSTNDNTYPKVKFVPNIVVELDKEDIQQQNEHHSKFPIVSNNEATCSKYIQQVDQLHHNQEMYENSQMQPPCSKRVQQVDPVQHDQASYQSYGSDTRFSYSKPVQQVDPIQYNQEIYQRSQPQATCIKHLLQQHPLQQASYQRNNSEPKPSCSKLLQQVDPIQNNEEIYQRSNRESEHLQQVGQHQHNQEIYRRDNSQPQPSCSKLLQQVDPIQYNQEIYQRSIRESEHLQQVGQHQHNQEIYQRSINNQPQPSCSKYLKHDQEIYPRSNGQSHPSYNRYLQQVDQFRHNQEIYESSETQSSCSNHLQQVDPLKLTQASYERSNLQPQSSSSTHLQEVHELQQNRLSNDQLLQPPCSDHLQSQSSRESYQILPHSTNPFDSEMQLSQTLSEQGAYAVQLPSNVVNNPFDFNFDEHVDELIQNLKGDQEIQNLTDEYLLDL